MNPERSTLTVRAILAALRCVTAFFSRVCTFCVCLYVFVIYDFILHLDFVSENFVFFVIINLITRE